MSNRWLFPLVFALIACPSPPEDGSEGEGQGQNQGQGPGNQGGAAGGAGAAGGGPDGEGKLDPTTGTRCNTAEAESAAQAEFSQEDLAGIDNVTFSGTIGCDGCDMNLILQATEQVDQNTTPPEGGPKLLTSTTVTAGAPYSLLLPKSGSAIVLELVGDADGSGSATAGEWFGVQDGQGNNKADMDRADVNINVTLCAGGESTAVSTPNNAQGPAPQDPPPPPEAGAGGPPPVDGAPAGDAPGAIPAPQ